MGPKNKFSQEEIIEAAFKIAKTDGIGHISMRKIAEKLGSSVAPIYVNFKSIDELNAALIDRMIGLSQQLLHEENTGRPFYDIGRASLRFAVEYPLLFKDLVINSNDYMKGYDEKFLPVLLQEMQEDSELQGFTVEQLKIILLKMRIFQLGLSVMAANSLLPLDWDVQDMMDILTSTADDIILAARWAGKQ